MRAPFSSKHLMAMTIFMSLMSTAQVAHAQNIPSSADPGRIKNDIDNQFNAAPPIELKQPVQTKAPVNQAPAGAEAVKFVLNDVIIEGGTRFPYFELEKAYHDLLYKEVTLAEIFQVANKITAIYQKHGYILSRALVPEQEVQNGIVRLAIIEGSVKSFIIQNDQNAGPVSVNKQIGQYAEKLINTGVLTSANLERYLLLMNDLPGAKVTSVLVPIESEPGNTQLVLQVAQRKYQGSLGTDNFGNTYLGTQRFTVSGQANSLLASTDQINGAVLLAPDHGELQYFSSSYHQNIGNDGFKSGINISHAITKPTLPNSSGGLLQPEGQSVAVSFDATYPVIRSRSHNVFVGAAFEYNKNKTDYAPGLSAIETEDRQRVLRLNSQMNYLDPYNGYNSLNVIASQGLDILDASKKNDSNLSRSNGDPQFSKFSLDLSRRQTIKGPFSALFAASGQYSANSLLASEQFGFGGNDIGRGYDSSEITGDHGVSGKVELAYSSLLFPRVFQQYQLYTFYDIGKVWTREPGAGQPEHESAASTGMGVRFQILPQLQSDMYIAKPLTYGVSSRGEHAENWRFNFSVSSSF